MNYASITAIPPNEELAIAIRYALHTGTLAIPGIPGSYYTTPLCTTVPEVGGEGLLV